MEMRINERIVRGYVRMKHSDIVYSTLRYADALECQECCE